MDHECFNVLHSHPLDALFWFWLRPRWRSGFWSNRWQTGAQRSFGKTCSCEPTAEWFRS